jgi:uncharacterized protein
MRIESLYRYPVKGLTPEPLARAALTPGRCVPWDRAFALVQGDAALNPAQPGWVPKTNFMCLLRNARIALLRTRFDDEARLLTVRGPNGEILAYDPFTADGQARFTDFFSEFLGAEARYGADGKAPSFRYFPDHSFCDHKTQVVSLIGHGSLGALETAVGEKRDKHRFRANIYIEGIAPWAEFGWIGKRLQIGETVLAVQERIDRCRATEVNPDNAERDAAPVRELRKNFGHVELGIFAEVLTGGEIHPGDAIRVL